MIICVCRGISELEIEQAIKSDTVKYLLSSRDTVPDCGICVKLLEKRISEIRQRLTKHN